MLTTVILGLCLGPPLFEHFALTYGLSPTTVRSITLQPNGDQPNMTLDAPDDIAAFISWLSWTRNDGMMRSAPPPLVFEGSVTFADGHSESFQSSAILPLLKDYSDLDQSERWDRRLIVPRSDVRIHFRGMTRSGDQRTLAALIRTTRHAAKP